MLKTLLTLAITAFCGVATAQPVGFKDLVLGAPLASEGVSTNLKCTPSGGCYWAPRGAETIAGYGLDTVMVMLIDEKVSSITLSFHSRAFDAVRDALAAKYAGMKCTASVVQNGIGAKFDQVDCAYTDQTGSKLLMTKRASTVDASLVVMDSRAWRALTEQAAQKGKTAGRKDL